MSINIKDSFDLRKIFSDDEEDLDLAKILCAKATNLNCYLKTKSKNRDSQLLITQRYDNVDAETALWKAVILQALIDISSKSKKKMANIYRMQADRWINLRNKDFVAVCTYANFNSSYIFETAKRLKNNNPFFNNGTSGL